MTIHREEIELVEADEETVKEISQMNTSADDMTHYLDSLSPEQMSAITEDLGAFQTLYSAMLASAELPQKTFAAKTRSGTVIGYVTVKGYESEEPELQIEVAPDYQHQGYGHEMLYRMLLQIFVEAHAKIVLYRVRPDNMPSIRLVESFHGILREPASEAEALLLKSYQIRDYVFAHEFSMNNRDSLRKDRRCGCFYCGRIFDPAEIEERVADTSGTAVCPYCGIDSVIGAYTGFPITQDFLRQMRDYWF